MQYKKRHLRKIASPIIAATLVLLVLAINVLAACPALHEKLHHDAKEHDHECAITLFAHGLVEHSTVIIAPVTPVPGFEIFPLVPAVTFSSRPVILASDRAPPLSASVS